MTTDYQKAIKALDKPCAVIYNKLPEGWRYIDGAQTAPMGYRWASNGKSRFSGEYEHALIKEANNE